MPEENDNELDQDDENSSSSTAATTSYLARITSWDILHAKVFGHKKPSMMLFYHSDMHSSLADVLWPQVAKKFRTVIDVSSYDVAEATKIQGLHHAPRHFGVTKLPTVRVQFAYKMLRNGGDGLFVLDLTNFSATELYAFNGTIRVPADKDEVRRNYNREILRAEDDCESEDDLMAKQVSKDFLKDMEKYARRVVLRHERVVQNVQTLTELQKISDSALNRLVTVLFMEETKATTSSPPPPPPPLGFLLVSKTPSQGDVLKFVTVLKSSPLGQYLLETAIPSIASKIPNQQDVKSNIWLFSSAFLRQDEKCRNDNDGRLNNDNYFSDDQIVLFVKNNTYVQNVLEGNCMAKPFSIPTRETDGDDFDPTFQSHVDFDKISTFLDYWGRPPPSVHTPAPECRSFLECARNHPGLPFIVKNTSEFHEMNLTYARAVELALNAPADSNKLKGAVPSGDKMELSVPDAMKLWLNDTLVGNYLYITPQTRTNWFPMPQVTIDEDKDPENSHRTLIYTYARAYTGLHADPGEEGGSWMHLFAGRKLWQFYHPKHHLYFVGNLVDGHPSVIDSSKVETYSCLAEENDTVYFPPSWLHRVWTFEKSFGLNSYLTPKGLNDQEAKEWIALQNQAAVEINRRH